MIIAYVKPERLNDVKQALYEAEVFNMSVTNIVGSGRQRGFSETYRGVEQEVNLLKKVRIEIGLNDDYVEAAKAAIIKGARTGEIGDGVMFVLPVEYSVRIRTGEEGPPAMG